MRNCFFKYSSNFVKEESFFIKLKKIVVVYIIKHDYGEVDQIE